MNTEIFATHGIVKMANPSRFVHRNLLDYDDYIHYLANREPFKRLEGALESGGAALTIDDSTKASADAALEARRVGHEVTLFVNPENVEHNRDYPLLQLNMFLDEAQEPFRFDGLELRDSSFRAKKEFRKRFKERMNCRRNDLDRCAYVQSLSDQIGICINPLPDYLRPLEFDDLRYLIRKGVSIQNHGWSHSHYRSLTNEEAYSNTLKGRAWLEEKLEIKSKYFAVPFGDVWPSESASECKTWFLLMSKEAKGYVSNRVFNRIKLTVN